MSPGGAVPGASESYHGGSLPIPQRAATHVTRPPAAPPAATDSMLEQTLSAVGHAAFRLDPATGAVRAFGAVRGVTGREPGAAWTLDDLLGALHPADRALPRRVRR